MGISDYRSSAILDVIGVPSVDAVCTGAMDGIGPFETAGCEFIHVTIFNIREQHPRTLVSLVWISLYKVYSSSNQAHVCNWFGVEIGCI